MESSSDHVILPPPSARNPIPSLPAALRIDNKERLLEVLLANPTTTARNVDETTASTPGSTEQHQQPFRQLLVFGKESLRTLLMRQVLQDPHTRSFGKQTTAAISKSKKSNKNWDNSKSFPLPKQIQNNVVGTRVLLKKTDHCSNYNHNNNNNSNGNSSGLAPQRNRTSWKGLGHDVLEGEPSIDAAAAETKNNSNDYGGDDDDLYKSPDDLFEHIDVITYLVRPWDMDQTMAVISRIKGCALAKDPNAKTSSSSSTTNSSSRSGSRTHKQHHRIVYVPKVTAMCSKILADHKIWDPQHQAATRSSSCVSVVGLQLDLFPLGSDLLSLEYDEGLREGGSVGGTPSMMIETTSRALTKVQDVVGRIPRIQSLGIWGEDVLEKLLNETVDEYWAARRDDPNDDNDNDDASGDGDEETKESSDYNDASTDAGLAMVLIDRRLDMVTPMVTPLTYEGLLDELVGIECGHVEVPEDIINPPDDDQGEDDGESNKSNNNNNPFENSPSPSKNPFEDNDPNSNSNSNAAKVALGVHEGDTLFAEVRDQHVEKFGSFLQNQAVALKESHANFTSKETKKDLDEIEKFVKQIPIFTQSLRSLTNHIHLAELIKAQTEDVSFRDQWNTERAMIEGEYCYDFLEECIFGDHPPYKVLRLICLQSLASGGIRANKFDQLRQHIVQVYGYEFLPVLHDLETMGWIKKMEGNLATNFVMDNSSRSLFQNLKRNLILIHAEVNTVEPDDVSYVSSGYAPLTVRLVQSAMQGWRTPDKEDVLKDVFQMMASSNNLSGEQQRGRLLDVRQSQPPRDLPTTLRHQHTKLPFGGSSLGAFGRAHVSQEGSNSKTKKPTLMVVYLGGVTYAEIASLRFLSKKDTFPYHIIVVTTKILNGSKLLQQMGQ